MAHDDTKTKWEKIWLEKQIVLEMWKNREWLPEELRELLERKLLPQQRERLEKELQKYKEWQEHEERLEKEWQEHEERLEKEWQENNEQLEKELQKYKEWQEQKERELRELIPPERQKQWKKLNWEQPELLKQQLQELLQARTQAALFEDLATQDRKRALTAIGILGVSAISILFAPAGWLGYFLSLYALTIIGDTYLLRYRVKTRQYCDNIYELREVAEFLYNQQNSSAGTGTTAYTELFPADAQPPLAKEESVLNPDTVPAPAKGS